MSQLAKTISFVLPCLNEERTLGRVLETIRNVCESEFQDRQTEVVVSDNGSTDRSVEIARDNGARVVHCEQRGYGAALQLGIREASGEVVIFADADGTYDLSEAPRLVDALGDGSDLVIGSRLQGNVYKGAMPFSHRYIGTPVLTFLLNLLHAGNGSRVSDCNSGFRCFRREAFLRWDVRSPGMEFASEMLIKALKAKAKLSHVPVSLHPDSKDRVPHLQRWRDGMRHLIQILMDCPRFFSIVGTALFSLSWLVILVGLFVGRVSVASAELFGLHSMLFALLGTVFGMTVWATGLYLAVRNEPNIRLYRFLLAMPEDALFWSSVAVVLLSVTLFSAIVAIWAMRGFRNIYLERQTLAIVTFGTNGILCISSLITAHLLKRPE